MRRKGDPGEAVASMPGGASGDGENRAKSKYVSFPPWPSEDG